MTLSESGENKNEEEQTVENIKVSYPLKRKWTWWYLNDERSKNWEDRLKRVYTFTSVPEFWALYDAIRPPSGLNALCDYNVFRDDIQPMWEVPENKKGGRWLITIEKNRQADLMDHIWLEILMALIGEQFGDAMESICGLVCNVRTKGSKISVWTKDWDDDETNMKIGEILKQKLLDADISKSESKPIFDVLRYEDHDSCQRKNASTVKAKLSISATDGPTRPQ